MCVCVAQQRRVVIPFRNIKRNAKRRTPVFSSMCLPEVKTNGARTERWYLDPTNHMRVRTLASFKLVLFLYNNNNRRCDSHFCCCCWWGEWTTTACMHPTNNHHTHGAQTMFRYAFLIGFIISNRMILNAATTRPISIRFLFVSGELFFNLFMYYKPIECW